MAEYYLGWELVELEERVWMLERRVERKVLRDTQNPYDLPINAFMIIYLLWVFMVSTI